MLAYSFSNYVNAVADFYHRPAVYKRQPFNQEAQNQPGNPASMSMYTRGNQHHQLSGRASVVNLYVVAQLHTAGLPASCRACIVQDKFKES